MPTAPKKPCTFPGCSELVQSGTRCAAHAVARRPARVVDRFRGTAAGRGYGARWQAFRPLFLGKYPLCPGVLMPTAHWTADLAREFHTLREHEREAGHLLIFSHGRTDDPARQFLDRHPIYRVLLWDVGRPTVVIDHIVPHRGDAALFWAEWNMQAITSHAHNKKTAREGRAGAT